jgi:hypothetical protein
MAFNIAPLTDDGPPHPMYTLCPIFLLLLVRQTFTMATANLKAQNNEKLYYPLSVLPEFLVACLFVAPWRRSVVDS